MSLFACLPAQAIVTPANSVINPATGTLYVPENDASPRIRVYQATGSDPAWTSAVNISLPAKSYGLAVYQEAGQEGLLLVTINNGSSSKLRYYKLDVDGVPDTSYEQELNISAMGSSPMGVVIQDGIRAFVADGGNARIYWYSYDSGSDEWTQEGFAYAPYYNLYDIEVSPTRIQYINILGVDVPVSSIYEVYASTKVSSGKVLVYRFEWNQGVGDVLDYLGETSGLLRSPTYLKVNSSGDKLYVAVNGSSGGDIKVFNITLSSPYFDSVKTINSPVTSSYGWTGFAFSPNDTTGSLYFSQVQNSLENAVKVYKVDLPITSSSTNVNSGDEVADLTGVQSDGLVCNETNTFLALTYSGDGSKTEIDLSGLADKTGPIATINNPDDGNTVSGGVSIQALIDDTTTGGSNIEEAEYFIDTLVATGSGTALSADDGTFNSVSEEVSATWDSTTVSNGTHTIHVRGKDAEGNWGGADIIGVTVDNGIIDTEGPAMEIFDPTPDQTVSGIYTIHGTADDALTGGSNIAAAEYFIDTDPGEGLANAFIAFDDGFDEVNEHVSKGWFTDTVADGPHTIYARAQDSASNWGNLYSVDVIVDNVPNNPPTSFSKSSPADGANECCDVNLQWTASTDPDVGDTLTYTIVVYNEGDYGVPVYTTTTASTNQSIPLLTLTLGNTYEWNVSVTDGAETVWADGAEGNRWSFTYIEAITVPGNPYITMTSPLDAATDVNIDAAVTITFNESIQSGTFTYAVVPAVTGDSVSWNPTHTVATIAHDDFAMTTPYTITVTNAEDVDESLPLTSGPVPNPFSFTTGTGSGDDPVINIVITRDADAPGSDIIITWDTDPPGLGIDVYELLCTYDDVTENYDRYFTTDTTDWTAVATNVTIGTYTISSSVGDGTARYYKLIPNGDTLVSGDLTEGVVAKFDIAVGPSDTEPERFFISIPIEVADTSVTSIIGGQVEETDMILSFDIDKNVTYGSMYSSSAWGTFPSAIGPITNMEAGYTYGYYTPTAKYITAVGMVPETDHNRTLDGGPTLVANWLANPYPMPVLIADAGLNSSSYVTALIDIVDAAVIYHFDANAELIDTTNGMAFHYPSASEWYEGSLTTSSPLQMVPGKGYMFTEPIQSTFSWTLVKPY